MLAGLDSYQVGRAPRVHLDAIHLKNQNLFLRSDRNQDRSKKIPGRPAYPADGGAVLRGQVLPPELRVSRTSAQ